MDRSERRRTRVGRDEFHIEQANTRGVRPRAVPSTKPARRSYRRIKMAAGNDAIAGPITITAMGVVVSLVQPRPAGCRLTRRRCSGHPFLVTRMTGALLLVQPIWPMTKSAVPRISVPLNRDTTAFARSARPQGLDKLSARALPR